MIRVLNVLYEERFGGPQARVLQVAVRLRGKGIETCVVIPRGDAAFASRLDSAQIEVHQLDLVRLKDSLNPIVHIKFLLQFWPNVMAVRQLIRQHKIQVVHANGLINLQAQIAARLEGASLVWHLNDVSTPWPFRRLFVPLVRRWADRIVISSWAVARYYFSDTSPIEGRLHVVYPPVDTDTFTPAIDGSMIRRELGIADNCPIIGTVGNLHPGKGLEFFLEAAASIKRRFPMTKFLVIGAKLANRQSYYSLLLRRTQELGLEKDVVFMGRRDDIPQLMRAMTIYVHPSRAEAGPIAVLEASACGTPVVTTDVGGPRELVDHGKSGLLVKAQSPIEIARAVIRLLECPQQARTMGTNGAQRVRQLFSLEACVSNHLDVYMAAAQSDKMTLDVGGNIGR